MCPNVDPLKSIIPNLPYGTNPLEYGSDFSAFGVKEEYFKTYAV